VVVNGKLVHSKQAGKGRCESAAEIQAVVDYITEALDA